MLLCFYKSGTYGYLFFSVAGVVIFFSIDDFCQTASKKMSPVSILVRLYTSIYAYEAMLDYILEYLLHVLNIYLTKSYS